MISTLNSNPFFTVFLQACPISPHPPTSKHNQVSWPDRDRELTMFPDQAIWANSQSFLKVLKQSGHFPMGPAPGCFKLYSSKVI
jgi:hypothetical protein